MILETGSRKQAMRFILLLGVVSLLADVTYEGARSITGPYLGLLGASAAVVGVVAGAGELIGYALRLVSGYLTDRTGKYWSIAILGYAVNLLAVPALALAGRWEVAALLMVAERLGKAIRAPARDVLLADAAKAVGTGWGFGVHEAMDQIGAVAGPLVVAGVLATMKSYRTGFAVLLVPALAALSVLAAARLRYPQAHVRDLEQPSADERKLPRSFWIYVAAAGLIAAGYADFPLVAFHLKKTGVASDIWIPLLYAIAMGVDAVAALAFGRLFDRWGKKVLIGAPLAAILAAPLVFSGSFPAAVAGMVFWGVGMGVQESVLRAAVAEMVPRARRGAAYGVFNSVFGICWFAGSALMGLLYETSAFRLVAFALCAQLAAIPLLLRDSDHRATPRRAV
jgi:MFS family permease